MKEVIQGPDLPLLKRDVCCLRDPSTSTLGAMSSGEC